MDLLSLLPSYSEQIPREYNYRFTVFTPIFNRADTIHRVFNSLNKQTFKDFELLIINDGSTDASHDEILKLITQVDFPVNYINNETNKHKMACIIQGVENAKGEFFLTFDSDDECTPNALEVFNNTYNKIPDDKKENVCSLTCLCKDQFGNLIGERFDTDVLYSSTFKNIVSGRYKSEKWGFTKTNILKGIMFNETLFSKGLIPEGILWNLLSKENFDTLYFNEVLRVYYIDSENSLSSGHIKNNALGLGMYSLANVNWFYKLYLIKNPILFLKQIYLLLLSSKYLSFTRIEYSKAIESDILKFIFNVCWPFRHLITKNALQ